MSGGQLGLILKIEEWDDQSLTELCSSRTGGEIKESRYIKKDIVTEYEGYWREKGLEWLLAWATGYVYDVTNLTKEYRFWGKDSDSVFECIAFSGL